MPPTQKFEERVVRVEKPSAHFTLLRNEKGDFLGTSEGKTAVFDRADDKAIWKEEGDTYRHVVSGLTLDVSAANNEGVHLVLNGKSLGEDGSESSVPGRFQPGHGPAHLPSEYLQKIRENGWVCLPSILSPHAIEELQRVSCTGKWDNEELDKSLPTLTQSVEVARAATEPVSLWVMREYMQCREIRLAHRPGFAVVAPDDGERKVGGWHSDYPYLWGIARNSSDGNRIVPHNAPNLVLGVQRNLCVTEFKRENGATCFKLGSHTLGEGPPLEWGSGNTYREEGSRRAKGLPYTGSEADVVEAPASSYVIYDARTWHRAGVNRTNKKRAAMLQSVVPMYIMPFMDTARPYKEFLASPLVIQLTEREHIELENLLVSRIDGPQGRFAITMDEELSR